MPRVNLTAVSVEKLRPPSSGQVEYYDRRLPAFGLRVSYRGSRSWFLMTRVDGKLARLTLGTYPALSLADAREKARGTARLVSEGKDPRTVAAEAKRQQDAERANTFEACAADFLRNYVERRLRTFHAARIPPHSDGTGYPALARQADYRHHEAPRP